MTPQLLGGLLHRWKKAPHGSGAPARKELLSPSRIRVVPELLEQFPEQMKPDALEVVLKDCL
jgi:hypothetical protein